MGQAEIVVRAESDDGAPGQEVADAVTLSDLRKLASEALRIECSEALAQTCIERHGRTIA